MELLKWFLPWLFLAFAEGEGGAATDTETGEKQGDSETQGEKPSSDTEGSGEPGEGEKTHEPSDEDVEKQLLEGGADIPYVRFKNVIDNRNKKFESFGQEISTLKAELEELNSVFKNPSVFRAVLQSQGITDKKVLDEKMREAGFDVKEEVPQDQLFKQFTQGVDLNKQDGWFEVMRRMSEHYAKQAVSPLQTKLSKADADKFINEQERDAQKLAKDVFKIEYGQSGKDEGNPETAIGVMAGYLKKHPEDARMGQVKILRLAMSEKGFQLGEQKGIEKEKERNKRLKNSQMEGDQTATREQGPSSDWPVSKVLAWSQEHNK